MKNPTLRILILSLLILLVVSCINNSSSLKESNPQALQVNQNVSPPAQAWDIPYEKHQLKADQAQTIETASGSVIEIPAGVLVDANGNAVQGEVGISYREFRSAADIFRSGIPMRYDSAESSHILRSAGMFEIRAAQAGEPLFIAEGKKIEVQMASSKSGSFNFYKLDEEGDNNWQFITSATAVANDLPADSIYGDTILEGLALNPDELLKPEKANQNAMIFDFKTNYQVYPELAKYKNVLWQDADKTAEGVLDIEKNDWIFGEVWTEAKVKRAFREGAGFYYLDIQNNAKKARILVKPVLEGSAYVQALKTYQQNKAEQERLQQLYAQQAQQAFRAQQAAANRFYTGVTSFGFYNWDLIIKRGNLEVLAADFQFQNGEKPEEVYLIIPDAPVAVKFNQKTWSNFTFSRHWECMVVAIMPDKSLAIIDDETLKTELTAGGENVLTFQEGVRVAFPKEISSMLAP